MAKKFKLTSENYHSPEANRAYFSVSQIKTFLDCPARAMAEINGEWKTPMTKALLMGSYFDAWVEGTLEEFKEEHPEIFNSRTKELKADYQQVEEIIKRVQADELFMKYLEGDKQKIITFNLFGAPFKMKMDVYKKGERIVDTKLMRSMERIMGISFVEHWHYDWQTALYAEGEYIVNRKKDKQRLPTYLAVATKEDETDLEIIHIPAWRNAESLEEIEKLMPRLIAYKNGELEAPRCEKCAYCRRSKKLKAPIDFELVGFSAKELAAMRGETF
jgi:hypothetical protein